MKIRILVLIFLLLSLGSHYLIWKELNERIRVNLQVVALMYQASKQEEFNRLAFEKLLGHQEVIEKIVDYIVEKERLEPKAHEVLPEDS